MRVLILKMSARFAFYGRDVCLPVEEEYLAKGGMETYTARYSGEAGFAARCGVGIRIQPADFRCAPSPDNVAPIKVQRCG